MRKPPSTGLLRWWLYRAAQPFAPHIELIDRWQASQYAVMRYRENYLWT